MAKFKQSVSASIPLCALLVLAACDTSGVICSDYQSGYNCGGTTYRLELPSGEVIWAHRGIDFRGAPGTPVMSATHGVIYSYGYGPCGGYVVIRTDIPHPKNDLVPLENFYYATYAHIDPRADMMSISLHMRPGDLIGHIQSLSDIPDPEFKCSGPRPHVHYGLHYGPRDVWHVNPHEYWANGPHQFTCFETGQKVPEGKAVAPVPCTK